MKEAKSNEEITFSITKSLFYKFKKIKQTNKKNQTKKPHTLNKTKAFFETVG